MNTIRMMNRIATMIAQTRKASSFQERCQHFQRAKAPTVPNTKTQTAATQRKPQSKPHLINTQNNG